MVKIKFDIWHNPEGLSQLAASGSLGEEERSIREDDAEIVHSVLRLEWKLCKNIMIIWIMGLTNLTMKKMIFSIKNHLILMK